MSLVFRILITYWTASGSGYSVHRDHIVIPEGPSPPPLVLRTPSIMQNNNGANKLNQRDNKCTVDDGLQAIKQQNRPTILRKGQETADRPRS
jgi:hypothetical protein